MTCIVGVKGAHTTYIGGDAAAVSGWTTNYVTPKVWYRDGFVFGGTASFRMMDLLRHSLEIPVPDGPLDLKFMQTHFIDQVRLVLKEGGFMKVTDGQETGGSFLVGGEGKLYHIDSDQQVTESLTEYSAVGSGDDTALGSLYTSIRTPWTTMEKILTALRAASIHIGSVTPPFTIISSEGGRMWKFDDPVFISFEDQLKEAEIT